MLAPWLVFVVPATALPAPSPAPAIPELKALAPIIGVWKSDEVISRCDWSPNHRWVVCDQQGTINGEPFDALSMYSYSPKLKRYVFFTQQDGATAPFEASLKIEGKRWTYLPNDADSAKRFRTINEFSAPDHYDWKAMKSDDGGKTWTVAMSGTSKRVK